MSPAWALRRLQLQSLENYVHLAGTNLKLSSVTVTMSDWALFSDYSNDARYSVKLLSFALAGHTSSGALCVLGLLSQQTLELDR